MALANDTTFIPETTAKSKGIVGGRILAAVTVAVIAGWLALGAATSAPNDEPVYDGRGKWSGYAN